MPEITEAKLYEAFGLDAPAADAGSTGGQAQEPAAPAPEGTPAEPDTGAQVQEIAAPAEGTASQEPENPDQPSQGEEPEDGSNGQEPGKAPLTQEQRRQNAARRRQQEQQVATEQAVNAALAAERQKQAADLEQFFVRMGVKNTFTNQPIKTMEEFNSWKQQYDAEQFGKDLKAGKATPEQFTQMIDNHPMVKQAQQVIQLSQAQQKQQEQAVIQQRVDADLAEIGKLDPSIKTVADLLQMPKAEEFKAFVAKGNGFLDAYRLSHFEELTAANAEKARQQAINLTRGKDHLQATGGSRGSGAEPVPAGVMAMYRAFNPRATEAEIQAHYNKTKPKS